MSVGAAVGIGKALLKLLIVLFVCNSDGGGGGGGTEVIAATEVRDRTGAVA